MDFGTYTGEIDQNGNAQGIGIWQNNSRSFTYIGHMRQNQFHGQGKFTLIEVNLCLILGVWISKMPIAFKNSACDQKWIGEFKDGKRDGKFTHYT